VRVHSLTLFGLFALPGACDVTPGSTSRPATSQPPYLGRKPNARVATLFEVEHVIGDELEVLYKDNYKGNKFFIII
jgi:hypothetical protein